MSNISKIEAEEERFTGDLIPVTMTGLTKDQYRKMKYGNWHDGIHTFFYDNDNLKTYILNEETLTWSEISLGNVPTNLGNTQLISDGKDWYFNDYIWNKETLSWEGNSITTQLESNNYPWDPYTWTDFKGNFYWDKPAYTPGVFDKKTKTWKIRTEFTKCENEDCDGTYIFSTSTNTYYFKYNDCYELKGNHWKKIKNYSCPFSNMSQLAIISDGINLYYFYENDNYIFNEEIKNWEILSKKDESDPWAYGRELLSTGTNYYFYGSEKWYLLERERVKTNFNIRDINHEEEKITEGVHNLKVENNVLQYKEEGTDNWIIPKVKTPLILTSKQIKRKYFVPIDVKPDDGYDCPFGEQVFYINNKAYYFYGSGSGNAKIYCFNSDIKKWEKIGTFNQSLYWIEGRNVWSDGENIYYGWTHQINDIDKGNFSEITMTFPEGVNNIRGEYIWTDGNNYYHDAGSTHLVFNKETKTWENASWKSTYDFYSNDVWTDGYKIYSGWEHILNISEHKWEERADKDGGQFSGFFNGYYIWTDGKEILHTCDNKTHVFNVFTQKWREVPLFDQVDSHWRGGQHIWTDGYDIYYTDNYDGATHSYILKEENIHSHIGI